MHPCVHLRRNAALGGLNALAGVHGSRSGGCGRPRRCYRSHRAGGIGRTSGSYRSNGPRRVGGSNRSHWCNRASRVRWSGGGDRPGR
jgi:hypothetical protein